MQLRLLDIVRLEDGQVAANLPTALTRTQALNLVCYPREPVEPGQPEDPNLEEEDDNSLSTPDSLDSARERVQQPRT